MPLQQPPIDDPRVTVSHGVVLIRNADTTIGYCRFDDCGGPDGAASPPIEIPAP
jgi:hypothetical protein